MADIQLTNTANATGTYNSLPVTLNSNELVTNLVSGLTITKAADKSVWVGGNLTYTITITNNADASVESLVLTDILNPTLVSLVENSVKVNGTAKTYEYNSTTGLLTVNLDDIATAGSAVVEFQVQKK